MPTFIKTFLSYGDAVLYRGRAPVLPQNMEQLVSLSEA